MRNLRGPGECMLMFKRVSATEATFTIEQAYSQLCIRSRLSEMQSQIGTLQISPLHSKSLFAPRKRCWDSRRPIIIRHAASVSSKQIQDDQVELGKTGLQAYAPLSKTRHKLQIRLRAILYTNFAIPQPNCVCYRHQGELAGHWSLAMGGYILLGL